MLISNKNYPKRKQANRGAQAQRGLRGRPWAGKPSILENQNVCRRDRKSTLAANPSVQNRPRQAKPDQWGGVDPNNSEWRTRFLEGGFVIAAGLSDLVRNTMTHMVELVRGGREVIENVSQAQSKMSPSEKNGLFSSSRVEPDLGAGFLEPQSSEWSTALESGEYSDFSSMNRGFTGFGIDQPEFEELLPNHPDKIRHTIEWSKMDSQDQEEVGLEEDELYDQAGALRSMFSNRSPEL
ncbi:MAG: hypothetical protein HQL67_03440 [Magnetococcales bacterium]|nr:hypothetical protein [Magnetococcales bacterium]